MNIFATDGAQKGEEGKKQWRIAIVGGSLSVQGGGAPRSMAQQASMLLDQGCCVSLFVGESRKYPFTPEQFDVEGCEIIHSKLWGPSILGFFPVALFRLIRHIHEFDCIHLNGAWNFNTYLLSRICKFQNIPCYITARGHYSEYHHNRMPVVRKVLYWLMERGNLRNATAIHITAKWEYETSKRYLAEATDIVTIANPVDLRDFKAPPERNAARKRLGLDAGKFYLIHLGRLAPQKNAPFLVEAFFNANLDHAELIFIGPQEAAVRRELDAIIKSKPSKNCVRFIEFSKGKERCDWLAAADLFVLPSNDENFCIVAIEAVASGTHCVLSDRIGAVEYLPSEYCTVLPINMPAWVDMLSKMNRTRVAQIVPGAEVLAPFSHSVIGQQWMDVYERTLDGDKS